MKNNIAPVFIDTSALIALLNPRDQHHPSMSLHLKGLDVPFSGITSNLVLTELLTYYSRYGDVRVALSFQAKLFHDPHFEVIWIDTLLHTSACHYLEKYKDKSLSFVDATSFAIMKREHIHAALCFDQDFVYAGFKVLPEPS